MELVWLVDPATGTNDYMARVYDKLMFHGATFGDLLKRGRPIVSMTATDIANGATFPFLGTNFGLLCSDLNSYPVADAVAASNAFPVLFSPVTLRNYAERCHGLRPPLASAPSATLPETESAAARRRELSRLHDVYADPERTRWVHLSDGGIADNLALRGLLNFFIGLQAEGDLFRKVALTTRRILVISVDGEAAPPSGLGRKRFVGGLMEVVSAATGTQIDAYNFETLALAREQVQHLTDRVRAERCAAGPVISGHPCEDVRGTLVHLALSDIHDPEWRDRLSAIPTGLTIPDDDADALVRYGEELVRSNATINAIAAEADFPPRGPAVITFPKGRPPESRPGWGMLGPGGRTRPYRRAGRTGLGVAEVACTAKAVAMSVMAGRTGRECAGIWRRWMTCCRRCNSCGSGPGRCH